MEVVAGPGDGNLIVGLVVMVVLVVVMTRRLMVQLLLVVRPRVAGRDHGALVKSVSRRLVVMVLVPVRGLLDVVALMLHRAVGAIGVLGLLARVARRGRVVEVRVAQPVLRGDDRGGGAILVQHAARRGVEPLGRCSRRGSRLRR